MGQLLDIRTIEDKKNWLAIKPQMLEAMLIGYRIYSKTENEKILAATELLRQSFDELKKMYE